MENIYNNEEFNTFGDRGLRMESYRTAQIVNHQAEQDLQKWKQEEQIQKDINERLKYIRRTLGLQPKDSQINHYMQSLYESVNNFDHVNLKNQEMENTFGKNMEDEFSLRNAENYNSQMGIQNNQFQDSYSQIEPMRTLKTSTKKFENNSLQEFQNQDGGSDELRFSSTKKDKSSLITSEFISKSQNTSLPRSHNASQQKNNQQQQQQFFVEQTINIQNLLETIKRLQEQLIENNEKMSDEKQQFQESLLNLQNENQDLIYEIRNRENSERILKVQIQQIQENFQIRELEFQNEIQILKKEIIQQKDTRDIIQRGEAYEMKNYLIQLETELSLNRHQAKDLSDEKGKLEIKNEQLENDLKNISKKVQADLEQKYIQEIEDLKFICESLKKENETILNVQGNLIENRKTSSKRKNSINNQTNSGQQINSSLNCCNKFCLSQRHKVQEYGDQIQKLMDEKYILEQKLDLLECQSKIFTDKQESKIIQEKFNELAVFERRIKQLKEQGLFWKEKASKLSIHYMNILSQQKNEINQMKSQLFNNQKTFFSECENLIKEFTSINLKENHALKDSIKNLMEKNNEKQRIISDLRNKLSSSSQVNQQKQQLQIPNNQEICQAILNNKENNSKEINKKKKKKVL